MEDIYGELRLNFSFDKFHPLLLNRAIIKSNKMYYRRKIILALLEQFKGSLPGTVFHELLFLYCQKQTEPAFDFVPDKHSCFSFQANQDLLTMVKYKLVDDLNSKWTFKAKESFISQLEKKDRDNLFGIYNKFVKLNETDLSKYVYEKFPYYGVKSEISENIAADNQLIKAEKAKLIRDEYAIFTIGYEGRTVEAYANLLIKNDVKILCDVRKNPLSMKYGFSKKQLKAVVESVGITYLHFPSLGIESEKRKNLSDKIDYDRLFAGYKKQLKNKKKEIGELSELVNKNRRIALTCFERDVNYCHRNYTANELWEYQNRIYPVIHL